MPTGSPPSPPTTPPRRAKPPRPARRWGHALLVGLLAGLPAAGGAAADTVRFEARFVDGDDRPLAGLPVRLVAGGAHPRAAKAGVRLKTDADGRIARTVEMAVGTRRVTLDNAFARHPAQTFGFGLGLELRGRPALYWLEIDVVRAGSFGTLIAYLPGAGGTFDRRLTFHPDTHSWTMPGDPAGLLMSSPGAELAYQQVTGSAAAGWTVEVVVRKFTFVSR